MKERVDGEGTLACAAINNRHKVIAALLEAGANPNLRNIDGHTPLMCASQRGAAKAAKALLDGGGAHRPAASGRRDGHASIHSCCCT